MKRRTVLKSALLGTGAMLGAGAAWLKLAPRPRVAVFADLDQVRAALAAWSRQSPKDPPGHFSAPQMLEHTAQSIEMSMDGYPQLRAGWFRSTVGPLAFTVFDKMGRMRHNLHEPIPGAPDLVAGQLASAARRLEAALARFEAWSGPLAPHFAYGTLDHAEYTRAHLMHLANHWSLYADSGAA